MSSPPQVFIKVQYHDIIRRVRYSGEPFNEFHTSLLQLFEIPFSSNIQVSYKDPDGDVVVMSTDDELKDLIETNEGPIRLTLQTKEFSVAGSIRSNEDASAQYQAPYVSDVPDDEEERIHSSSKGKERADDDIASTMAGPSTTHPGMEMNHDSKDPSQENQGNDQQNVPPFFKAANEFSSLIESVTDLIEKNPQITEQFKTVMDQILTSVPVDIAEISEQLKGLREQQEKNQDNTQNAFSSRPFCTATKLPFACNRSFNGHPFAFHRGGFPYHLYGRFAGRQQCSPTQQPELTPAQMEEKLKVLNAMGFWGDENKDLLNRYNGNIDRVVEILLRT